MKKDEIIELFDAYDTYITNFCDDNTGYKLGDEVYPENVLEFIDNEWSLMTSLPF